MDRVKPLRPRCVFDFFFDLTGSSHELSMIARLLIILINYGLFKGYLRFN